jgi:hypothetical protein
MDEAVMRPRCPPARSGRAGYVDALILLNEMPPSPRDRLVGEAAAEGFPAELRGINARAAQPGCSSQPLRWP